MSKRSPDLTRELLQAVLDHWWECRRKRLPREPRLAPAGYLISYASLVARAGVVAEPRRLGGPLTEISELCKLRGWPPLAALVVRQDAAHPGVGYFRRADAPRIDVVSESHLQGWRAEAQACIDTARLPRTAPAVTAPAKGAPRHRSVSP